MSVCEAVRCLQEELIGNAGSAVVFVFHNVQGGERELLRQAPGHAERRRDVKPAADEYRRDAGDAPGPPADAIGRQERVLAEEVGH